MRSWLNSNLASSSSSAPMIKPSNFFYPNISPLNNTSSMVLTRSNISDTETQSITMDKRKRKLQKEKYSPYNNNDDCWNFQLHFSRSLLALSVFITGCISFGLGAAARLFYVHGTDMAHPSDVVVEFDDPTETIVTRVAELDTPCTEYSSKVYGDFHIETLLYNQRHCSKAENNIKQRECETVRDDERGTKNSDNKQNRSSEEEETAKDLQLPAGYELIIDARNMKYFDHSLIKEMICLFEAHGFASILSYHCHGHISRAGMSCLGLMPHSHFSIHYFPEESVLFIDFFSKGEMTLYSLYEDIKGILFDTNQEANFKLSQSGNFSEINLPEVKILWTQSMRGFREEFSDYYDSSMNPLDGEITQDIYGPKDDSTIKKRVSQNCIF